MAFWFWLKRPKLFYHRLCYWVWEKRNPDKPWLCPGTVAFCEKHLHKGMKALEFGSGRSTVWFAGKVGSLISVEHNREWHDTTRKTLEQANIRNVDYRHVPLDHPHSEGERPEYSPMPAYVAVADSLPDKSLDLVVVDGHYRTHCIRHAIPKVAPGGYLLVDDIDKWPSTEVFHIPPSWRIADDSTNGIKRCIVWQAA